MAAKVVPTTNAKTAAAVNRTAGKHAARERGRTMVPKFRESRDVREE
jgi:hypothetical protein